MEVKMAADPMDDGMWRITIFATSESEVRQHLALPEIMAALRELFEASDAMRAASLPGQNKALLADQLEERGKALRALYERLR